MLEIYEEVDVEEASEDDDFDEKGSIWEEASQENEEFDDDDIYDLPDQNRDDAEEIPTTIERDGMKVSSPVSAVVVPLRHQFWMQQVRGV